MWSSRFTVPSVSLNNVLTLISPRRGRGGRHHRLDRRETRPGQIRHRQRSEAQSQKVFIAPNFAISAVLADYFATKAAEILRIRRSHRTAPPTKVDAPSGTAIHTAHGIAEARKAAGLAPKSAGRHQKTDGGSRGQVVDGIHVHAVRLRGLNAYEEVLFGNAGGQR